jgi:hypothetical protein
MVTGPSGGDATDHHPFGHHQDDAPNRQVMMLKIIGPITPATDWR